MTFYCMLRLPIVVTKETKFLYSFLHILWILDKRKPSVRKRIKIKKKSYNNNMLCKISAGSGPMDTHFIVILVVVVIYFVLYLLLLSLCLLYKRNRIVIRTWCKKWFWKKGFNSLDFFSICKSARNSTCYYHSSRRLCYIIVVVVIGKTYRLRQVWKIFAPYLYSLFNGIRRKGTGNDKRPHFVVVCYGFGQKCGFCSHGHLHIFISLYVCFNMSFLYKVLLLFIFQILLSWCSAAPLAFLFVTYLLRKSSPLLVHNTKKKLQDTIFICN